jgi:hypothetical protein
VPWGVEDRLDAAEGLLAHRVDLSGPHAERRFQPKLQAKLNPG